MTPTPLPRAFRQRLEATQFGSSATGRTVADDQADVLDAVVQGIATGVVADARIGSPPAGFGEAPSLGLLGTAWMYVTTNARNDADAKVRAGWEAQLIVGAVREASHALGLPDVLGGTTAVAYPDGRVDFLGSAVSGQAFGLAAASSARLEERIRARLSESTMFADALVAFVSPYADAPMVTAELAAGVALVPGVSVAAMIFGDASDCEGTFVRVLDRSGAVLRAAAYANRTGRGIGWARPDAGPDGVPIGWLIAE